MNTQRFLSLVVAPIGFVLASCGGGSGVKLGDFPALAKTEGDAPFALVAPASASPAVFTYSSSDPKVATIAGSTVTVLLAGTTTITAAQPSLGSYNPTSTSAVLTVATRVCAAPTVRDNGQCVQPCTAPAVRENGVCVAPVVAAASYVAKSGLSWMPVSFALSWDNASAFCKSTTINGLTGWRQPSEFDLSDLAASGLMNGKGWSLGRSWSSTGGAGVVASHLVVNLGSGVTSEQSNDNSAFVACVR
ncbi:MAG: hypothetical protein QFF03_08475 [Pseudomonadota bacterium]|nr:hypothetical protein [Pseudomonadota bacterium]